jgi:two-component system cell cycle response regulator
MKSYRKNASHTFREFCQTKASNIYIQLVKNRSLFTDEKMLVAIHDFLKQFRDGSVVFQWKEEYEMASYLLRHFIRVGLTYHLPEDKWYLIEYGVKLIVKDLTRVEETEYYKKHKATNDKEIRVFIIDEDHVFVNWLIDQIEGSRYEVISIKSEELTQVLMLHPPDIILVNMFLPNQKGYEIVKYIRSNDIFSTIPIISLTHSVEEKHHYQLHELGVDDIIIKPFDLPMLTIRIENQLRRKQLYLNHFAFNQALSTDLSVHKEEMNRMIHEEWHRFARSIYSSFSLLHVKSDQWPQWVSSSEPEKINQKIMQMFYSIMGDLRSYDEIRRWDMGTFMVILPLTPLEGAEVVAKRISKSVTNMNWENNQETTLSIVAMQSSYEFNDADQFIHRIEKEQKELLYPSTIHLIQPGIYASERGKKVDKPKIVLIDDDPITITLLENYFDSDSWDIKVIEDQENTIDLIFQWKPDFIITEVNLLNVDGFLLCSQLRQIPEFENTKIIFLTHQALEKDIVRGFQVGADDYLTKPFSALELDARIKRMLSKKVK